MDANALCDRIRQTAFEIHAFFGHGHLEMVYENALCHPLRKAGFQVEQRRAIVGDHFADLLVERVLIMDLKAAGSLAPEHTAQILGHLKASRIEHGLLINFGSHKFEIRKFIWSKDQPQRAPNTQNQIL